MLHLDSFGTCDVSQVIFHKIVGLDHLNRLGTSCTLHFFDKMFQLVLS